MFDKNYYERIWVVDGVHRHDYCEYLCNHLISKYGYGPILDIGTGCGHLVKLLREKGCDAWGLEISDYAIENSCCPDHVRKGDVRNIPFPSDYFNVVHSQGLWGYFPKEDIQQAWSECRRVGNHQHHTIDISDNNNIQDPDHGYLLWESSQWWKNQFYPKVLVACPTHSCKEYAMQEWIDTVTNLTYPNYDILVVDNSSNEDMIKKWGDKINMVHLPELESEQEPMRRVNKSMSYIRKHFLEGEYTWWMNMEIDTIPPTNVIEQLIKYGQNSDWTSHAYPCRGSHVGPYDEQQGIGCSLLSRRMMEEFDHKDAEAHTPDGWLWDRVRPYRKYKVMELWGYFPVKHLCEGGNGWQ